ncbi:hypothetical protein Tco_0375101 [Tanacetum coccineum]
MLHFMLSCFGFFIAGIVVLRDYLDKHHVAVFLFGANEFSVGRRGTNPSDSKNELNLRTFSVMNETDGLGGVEESKWIFSGLSFFSFSFSSVLLLRESLCSAPAIRSVMAFNTVSILLVILLCCCLKSALNLDSLASWDAMKSDASPSRFD